MAVKVLLWSYRAEKRIRWLKIKRINYLIGRFRVGGMGADVDEAAVSGLIQGASGSHGSGR
jgi:nitrous oxide reductase accessory protein NosL